MNVENLLGRLERVRKVGAGWSARCPAHEDLKPSLSINIGERGIVLFCHGGCDTRSVCAALGISFGDLMNHQNGDATGATRPKKTESRPFEASAESVEAMQSAFARSAEAQAYIEGRGISPRVAKGLKWGFVESWTFDSGAPKPALIVPHYDLEGNVIGLKARTISGPKLFSQRLGSKIDGLYGAQLLDPEADEVLIFEGPEDAALAISQGFNATAIHSTAAKLEDQDIERLCEFKRIFLIGDQDIAGRRAMEALALRLPPEQFIRVRIPGFKDIGEMYADIPDTFAKNLRAALRWARASRDYFELDDLLTATEIGAGLDRIQPCVVDKVVPRNGVTMLFGEEKSGKSSLAHYIAMCVANAQRVFGKYKTTKCPVLYMDLENSDYDIQAFKQLFARVGPEPVRYRTRATGCPALDSPGLIRFCERYKPLLIVDSLTKFLRGTDPFHPGDMSELFDKLLNLCTAGATVILIHHATRDEAERYADSHQIGANVVRAFAVVSENRPRLHHVRLVGTLFRGAEPFSERLIGFPVIAEHGMFGLDAGESTEVDALVKFVADRGGETTRAEIKKQPGRAANHLAVLKSALSTGRLVAEGKSKITLPDFRSQSRERVGTDTVFPNHGNGGNAYDENTPIQVS
jgi:5S rRNA maturation endonuclease (ribonuclease M5)